MPKGPLTITTRPYHDWLIKSLRDPVEAAAYLNAAAEDGELRFLLKAVRNVVEAQGGIGELAKKTKLSRTTLYKTLSPAGNPEVRTLEAVLAVYGIRIGFFPEVDHHGVAAVVREDGKLRYKTAKRRRTRRPKNPILAP